mgnify:CR=1 FL=1
MLKWLCEHKWQIIAAPLIVGAAVALWSWMDDRHSAKMSVLQKEIAQNEQELQAAGRQAEDLRAQLARKQEEIEQLQRNNDRRVKEVIANAYKKARALSDDDLLAAYNRLISGARSRNADRERTDSGD